MAHRLKVKEGVSLTFFLTPKSGIIEVHVRSKLWFNIFSCQKNEIDIFKFFYKNFEFCFKKQKEFHNFLPPSSYFDFLLVGDMKALGLFLFEKEDEANFAKLTFFSKDDFIEERYDKEKEVFYLKNGKAIKECVFSNGLMQKWKEKYL